MKLDRELAQAVSEVLAPVFAPLPRPFLDHLLQQDDSYFSFFSTVPIADLSAQERLLETIWQSFIYQRSVIYTFISPFALAEHIRQDIRISSTWLQNAVSSTHPLRPWKGKENTTPSIKTISDWHVRNLLRYKAYDIPDPNSSAAILIMRSLLKKERGWLPGTMEKNEPLFSVWSLLPGQENPVAVPLTELHNLPAHAFCYTAWPGAAFDPRASWVMLPERGAIRWAGRTNISGVDRWNLSLTQIRMWQYDTIDTQPLQKLNSEVYQYSHIMVPHGLEATYSHLLAEGLLATVGVPIFVRHSQQFYGMPPKKSLFALLQEF